MSKTRHQLAQEIAIIEESYQMSRKSCSSMQEQISLADVDGCSSGSSDGAGSKRADAATLPKPVYDTIYRHFEFPFGNNAPFTAAVLLQREMCGVWHSAYASVHKRGAV